jgi:hypothetical protein
MNGSRPFCRAPHLGRSAVRLPLYQAPSVPSVRQAGCAAGGAYGRSAAVTVADGSSTAADAAAASRAALEYSASICSTRLQRIQSITSANHHSAPSYKVAFLRLSITNGVTYH